MYGSRVLNNASDADSTPLMCEIRQRIDVARHWLRKSPKDATDVREYCMILEIKIYYV